MAGKNDKKGKKPGRVKLSDEEKAARKLELANEAKNAKFVRLGNWRVTKAIKAIKAIGSLSGSNYEYTVAQTDAIEKLLKSAVSETMGRFSDSPKEKAAAIDLATIA